VEDLELYGSPDTVNIEDILSVDRTPLSSIYTSAPDMSVAMSVDRGTLLTVDFDDRSREIQETATAMLELADTTAMAGARRFRNPSLVTSIILLKSNLTNTTKHCCMQRIPTFIF